jgi:hypothetical protein
MRTCRDRIAGAWAGRALVFSAALASASLVLGCGAEQGSPQASSYAPTRSIGIDGTSVRFEDPSVRIFGRYPAGWYRAQALTELSDPREVLTLATYPLRNGAEAGECAPSTAREDMPRDGVFIWLLEYRPFGGDAWPELLRDRFPPKPRFFRLRRSDLSGDNPGCFSSALGYGVTFRAAERPFQLLVAFGGPPTDERLGEVEQILNSLEFDRLSPASHG